MNIQTQPNIDRVIDDAIALADLTGPQTGTAPPRRANNPERPTDAPPVKFEAGDGDRGQHVQIASPPYGYDYDDLYSTCYFIRKKPNGRYDYWSVERTGDYWGDFAIGAGCATLVLAVLRRPDCGRVPRNCLLGNVMASMMKRGAASRGHAEGFASVLSKALPGAIWP